MGSVIMTEKGDLIDSQTGHVMVKANTPVKNAQDMPKSEAKPISPPKVYTKYEVKPESGFTIKFGIMEYEDRILVVEDDDSLETIVEKHWVKFRMWTYAEELDMKSKATEFDSIRKVHLLNNDKLNEMKMRTLMQDWSFSEKDNSLKLLHVNNYLSDEGLKIIHSLYPTIVRHIINKMNEILEYNG